METLNTAFFFVTDKIISLQVFFIREAYAIGKTVLTIAVFSAALNYLLTGGGLKENLVKITKAVCFFLIIMFFYPKITGYITMWTFAKAQESTFRSVSTYIENSKKTMAENADDKEAAGQKGTYGNIAMKSDKVSGEGDPMLYFSNIVKTRKYGNMTYSVVAPAGAMEAVLLVAGECIRYSEETDGGLMPKLPPFGRIIKGLLCAFMVIFAGAFAVLEYLIAYMEYMLVTSVGIILFPLSIWEGSKFMAEKLIGAIVGFFIKLLFCNICVFLTLYGFFSLAKGYAEVPFTGRPDEVVVVIFVSLLFFYLSKSAPALAQSLLTGAPSLSASGAINAAASAVAGAAGAAGLAGKAGGMIAGGAAKAAFAGSGALTQASSAAKAVGAAGGAGADQRAAFMKSIGSSAKETVLNKGGELTRSLLGDKSPGGKGGGGGSGSGLNRHDQRRLFLNETNADGTKKTFKEQQSARKEQGKAIGENYMAKKQASAASSSDGQAEFLE